MGLGFGPGPLILCLVGILWNQGRRVVRLLISWNRLCWWNHYNFVMLTWGECANSLFPPTEPSCLFSKSFWRQVTIEPPSHPLRWQTLWVDYTLLVGSVCWEKVTVFVKGNWRQRDADKETQGFYIYTKTFTSHSWLNRAWQGFEDRTPPLPPPLRKMVRKEGMVSSKTSKILRTWHLCFTLKFLLHS